MNAICDMCGGDAQGRYFKDSDVVYFVKTCCTCGDASVPIERLEFFNATEYLPRVYSQNDCYMVNVTDFCTNSCRDCYNRGGKHRPLSDIMREVLTYPVGSRILLSGGEPLERPHLDLVIKTVSVHGYKPVLLTNGGLLSEDTYKRVLDCGLYVTNVPQISVSLGIPGTNRSFDAAYENILRCNVALIAFSVQSVDEVLEVERIAKELRGHYDEICIRTSWDGHTCPLFLSDISNALQAKIINDDTLYGYRGVKVEKDGIRYNLLSWSDISSFDRDRYRNRGVWYKGKNVVETLIDEITLPRL